MIRISDGAKLLQGIHVTVGSGLLLTEDSSGRPSLDVTPSAPGTTFESALNILANTSPGGHRQLRLIDRATASEYNWMFGTQSGGGSGDTVEITPSTIVGGTTFSTPIIVFKRTGNVGIGIAAPLSILHVQKSSTTTLASGATDGQEGVGATLELYNPSNTDNTIAQILFSLRASGHGVARIVAETVSGGDNVNLRFITEGGGTPADRMIILAAGNVGIGTTAPHVAAQLHVLGKNIRHQYSGTSSQKYGFFTATDQLHLVENAYYDGTWKTLDGAGGGGSGKAAVIQTDVTGNYALYVSVDNNARATDATRSWTARFRVDLVGNTEVLGSGSGEGKFTPNRMILPTGVDKWAS